MATDRSERPDLQEDIQELLNVREHIEGLLSRQAEGSQPRADLIDGEDSYRLVLEVPGLREENLEIALDGQELLVAGVRDDYVQDASYLLNERQTGPFQRTFTLPEGADGSRTSAHLQQGLLLVIIPKT
ncbi:MAG TPA: Hsp20/alpha crystallin family protein [Deinococcales bacterium]|nr:Hsp20/alpha crystallin family protein [Deinococcales bacterium]